MDLFPSSAVVAQVTVNHLVAGSNPASGEVKKIRAGKLFQTLMKKAYCIFMG